MSDSTLIVLLAIGTGISVGWMLRTWHARMNPEQIGALAGRMTEQLATLRSDHQTELERYTRAIESERAEWRGLIANLMAQRRGSTASDGFLAPPSASAAPSLNGGTETAKLRDRLLKLGVPLAMVTDAAEAVASGNIEALQQFEPLIQDQLLDMMRAETGAA